MAAWVLILFIYAVGEPVVSTAEFSSKQTCEQAADSVTSKLAMEGSVVVKTVCTPK